MTHAFTNELEPEKVDARTRAPLVIAAAMASAVLAPLVDELVLGDFDPARMRFEEALVGAWAAVQAAALGALAMHFALRRTSSASVLWIAGLLGILHPVLLFAPALWMHAGSTEELVRVLVAPFAIGALGAIVSFPVGFAFGVLFLFGVVPGLDQLGSPTHESPARASGAAARLLFVASVAVWALAIVLEGPYCQLVFFVLAPALEIEVPPGTDLAWTRLVVLPAPLALAALAFGLDSLRRSWRLERLASALAQGTHPRLCIEGAQEGVIEAVLPLRAADRAGRRVVCVRGAGAPYRTSATALARVV